MPRAHGRTTRIARALAVCHVTLAVVGGTVATARSETLPELLDAVAANARFASPARADVRITCAGCAASGRPAVFLGRGDALYVEVKDGQRALIRPGRILVAKDGKAAEAPPGVAFADTDVLLEDMAVFTPAALKVPQISDDGPAGVVITSAPGGPSVYSLVVHTIDRERHAIMRTLLYRDAINNLAKTRQNGGWTRVAGGWRPGEITVDDVRRATTARLTLAWQEAPDAPADLFEPAGLEHPSSLRWP